MELALLHDLGASVGVLQVALAKLEAAHEDPDPDTMEELKTLLLLARVQVWVLEQAVAGRGTAYSRHVA